MHFGFTFFSRPVNPRTVLNYLVLCLLAAVLLCSFYIPKHGIPWDISVLVLAGFMFGHSHIFDCLSCLWLVWLHPSVKAIVCLAILEPRMKAVYTHMFPYVFSETEVYRLSLHFFFRVCKMHAACRTCMCVFNTSHIVMCIESLLPVACLELVLQTGHVVQNVRTWYIYTVTFVTAQQAHWTIAGGTS